MTKEQEQWIMGLNLDWRDSKEKPIVTRRRIVAINKDKSISIDYIIIMITHWERVDKWVYESEIEFDNCE
jgi:hypothetical protein